MMMMMMMMMMKGLLPLSVLLLLSITHTVTKVVDSMSQCEEGFLLENKPPQVEGIIENGEIMDQNRYKVICQTYNNTERFVTLYDTKNKIPVFSAYTYQTPERRRGEELWKIEPQLENMENDENMVECDNNIEYEKQASKRDYNDATYNKGHLFPKSFAYSADDKTSTFTLTNAVPQAVAFNGGSWALMERCFKCILDKYCNKTYIVTGAKPGNNSLSSGVNIPETLWSAFCCNDHNAHRDTWLASAFWGLNDDATTFMPLKSLNDLSDELSINVFPGQNIQCLRNGTAAHRYQNHVMNNCRCSNP